MPLSGAALASLVYADHLTNFPTAVASFNSPTLGPFIPAWELVSALCDGLASAVLTLVPKDLYSGTASAGVAAPVPFVITEATIQAAVATFLASAAWVGPAGVLAADSLVAAPMRRLQDITLIQMNPSPCVGTGLVNPGANPDLAAQALAALNASLPAAFTASGKFPEGGVPGGPVNKNIAAQIPLYAAAWSTALASMTATVVYAGVATTTGIAGANTGVFL